MSAEARLLAEIADLDPVCSSTEGLDDGCHFCMHMAAYGVGDRIGYDRTRGHPGYFGSRVVANHHPRCLWVLTCKAAGKDIAPHGVADDL